MGGHDNSQFWEWRQILASVSAMGPNCSRPKRGSPSRDSKCTKRFCTCKGTLTEEMKRTHKMFRNHFDYSGYDRFTDIPNPYRQVVDKKLESNRDFRKQQAEWEVLFLDKTPKLSQRNLSIALTRVKDQLSRQVCLLQLSLTILIVLL